MALSICRAVGGGNLIPYDAVQNRDMQDMTRKRRAIFIYYHHYHFRYATSTSDRRRRYASFFLAGVHASLASRLYYFLQAVTPRTRKQT